MKPFSLLFVDDEQEFTADIKEFFDNLGDTVYTARNGQEGLLRAKEHQPPAVLSRYFDATATYGRHRDPASDT